MASKPTTTSPHLVGLVAEALGAKSPSDIEITSTIDANEGRGVFSDVTRVGVRSLTRRPLPVDSVVVKSPSLGPTGDAARASGACAREALAYRELLRHTPVRAPKLWLAKDDGSGGVSLVLEDLCAYRRVDQITGLDEDDALSVVGALSSLHNEWRSKDRLELLDTHKVRKSAPKGFAPESLENGVKALAQNWAASIAPQHLRAFYAMAERRDHLIEVFNEGPPTLCHGDPRADNLVFDTDGQAVLFDWQQIAVQPGAADLAWLAATSLTSETRTSAQAALIKQYGTTVEAFRKAMVLPGLAVLLLAQRQINDRRTQVMVATSLSRIGAALVDLDVPAQ